jgi:general secretion pathway protein H
MELLVVLAVAVLLMTAVPPMISAALPGMELKSAARRTVASLRLARETAIRTGADTALLVDVEGRRLELPGFRAVALPSRLDLNLEAASREMLDETRGVIRFFPDGSSTGGRILLTRGEDTDRRGYEVGVTWLTGRVRMAPWEPE